MSDHRADDKYQITEQMINISIMYKSLGVLPWHGSVQFGQIGS